MTTSRAGDPPEHAGQQALVPSVSDSPLFWVAIFCAMAAVGILAIGPKYAQRRSRLDARYENRIALEQGEGQGSNDFVVERRMDYGATRRRLVPLALFVGAIAAAAASLLAVKRHRLRGEAALRG